MEMELKANEVSGKYRCNTYRSILPLGLKGASASSTIYNRAAIMKNHIKLLIRKAETPEEAHARLLDSFKDLGYPTEETARLQAELAYAMLMRYVMSETRTPEEDAARIVHIGKNTTVAVKPDFVFSGTKPFTFETMIKGKKVPYTQILPYVEAVKIRCSKPKVLRAGRMEDTGAMHNLELFALMRYAKELAKERGQSDVMVCGSFYYLKGKNETGDKLSTDPDFWNLNSAISLEENVHHDLIELSFAKDVDTFVRGETSSDNSEMCKACELQPICEYKNPPKKLEGKIVHTGNARDIRLSGEQADVVRFSHGIARVNAGAGTGKTTCVALRAARLINTEKDPGHILMITFTNAGAREMRDRIDSYMADLYPGVSSEGLVVSTFNAYGFGFVRKEWKKLGFPKEPAVINAVQRLNKIADLLRGTKIGDLDYLNFDSRLPGLRGALSTVSRAFDTIKAERLEDVASVAMETGLTRADAAQVFDLYNEYNDWLRGNALVEFSDQEVLFLKLLASDPDYARGLGLRHIIVDEFQDTSALQFDIVKHLIDTDSFESLMVVGDDSQSIYGFRHTTPENIIDFFRKLGKSGQSFYLTVNRRSTPEIVDYANAVNELNDYKVDKTLTAAKPSGGKVSINVFWKRGDDVLYAVDRVVYEHDVNKRPYEDIAYIAYTKSELLRMADALGKKNIPSALAVPEPMLENSLVNGVLALARFTADPDDTFDAAVYLNAYGGGNIFTDTEEITGKIEALNSRIESVIDLEPEKQTAAFKALFPKGDEDEVYQAFLAELEEFRTFDDLLAYLQMFEKYGDDEAARRNSSYPGVVLTTAHSSKGREWPVVIANLSKFHKEGSERESKRLVEEKRRLLFVTATRAKDKLYLTGQAVAFGNKREDTRVLNQFLIESCEILHMPFPSEPDEKKKKK